MAAQGISRFIGAAVIVCGIVVGAPLAGAQQTASWDATWVGGWDTGNGTQIVIAGNQVVGFYWHDEYVSILESHSANDGSTLTFSWRGGQAILNRLGEKSARVLVRQAGQPDIAVDLTPD